MLSSMGLLFTADRTSETHAVLFADCVWIGSSIERGHWRVCDNVRTIAQLCSFVVISTTSIPDGG